MDDIDPALDAVGRAAVPLDRDHGALLDLIGDARFVLLGEASHGTAEFYRERAAITRRLIAERDFDAVAVEGDWPDAWRVNRHVRGLGCDRTAAEALAGFQRFPTWMWRNTEVVAFVDWLRAHNGARAPARRAGFYGLDLYSLRSSMAAVLAHLDHADPATAALARERYRCFDVYGDDTQRYGLMTGIGDSPSCRAAVAAMLDTLRRQSPQAADAGDREAAFDALQNALLVKNAESYYRQMFLSDVSSWNLRDEHMAESLAGLDGHLSGTSGRPAKVVVWAHNSHLGDARATEMGWRRGELNLGQLVRERHARDAVLVGFTTHTGSVTAASDWDAPVERKRVLPSRPDSIEGLLHASGGERFLLPLRNAPPALAEPRLQRAIGVVYRPETERQSHYFHASLARQFDAVVHIDTTTALEPLDRGVHAGAETAETWPSGV